MKKVDEDFKWRELALIQAEVVKEATNKKNIRIAEEHLKEFHRYSDYIVG